MFQRLKTKRRVALLEGEIREAQLESVKKLIESGSIYPQLDPDESSWRLVGQLGTLLRTTDEVPPQTRQEIRALSRKLYMLNSHYKGVIENYVSYVIGPGITIMPNEEDPAREEKADRWEHFKAVNNWFARQEEIVRRAFKDGEIAVWLRGEGETARMRFIDPEHIRDGSGDEDKGIVTESDDVETIKEFLYKPGLEGVKNIPASQIVWRRFGVGSNTKRGVCPLLAEMSLCQDARTWLNDYLKAMKIATAIVLLERIKGGPAMVTSFADQKKTSTQTNPKTGESQRLRRIEGGTILSISQGLEYEYLEPKMDHRLLTAGLRPILLAIAAGANQSEVMVSADASNANFASTMVAEAPVVKGFERLQKTFGGIFLEIYMRIMGVEWDDPYLPTVTAGRILSRDVLEETKANEILYVQGMLSTKTWRARADLDHEQEERNIEAEQAEMVAKREKERSVTGKEEMPPEQPEEEQPGKEQAEE